MDINLIRLLRSRGLALASTLSLAAAGLIMLVADAIAEDQAMMLGGLTLLFVAVTVYFLGPLRGPENRDDFWESVAWGKLFVGMVYASIAVIFLIVLFHSPEMQHVIHTTAL